MDDGAGDVLLRVTIRSTRKPQVGDKFASRHGQKGVISAILPMEDLPFSSSGMTPDILLNPHALPSRMTIGHLIEQLGGKAMTAKTMVGKFRAGEYVQDGTAYDPFSMDKLAAALNACGLQEHGYETVYSGTEGRMLPCKIFMGVVTYQALKHQVEDKIHARAHGPINPVTWQPVGGRAKEGALRLGDMEFNGLGAHGGACRRTRDSRAGQRRTCSGSAPSCPPTAGSRRFAASAARRRSARGGWTPATTSARGTTARAASLTSAKSPTRTSCYTPSSAPAACGSPCNDCTKAAASASSTSHSPAATSFAAASTRASLSAQ